MSRRSIGLASLVLLLSLSLVGCNLVSIPGMRTGGLNIHGVVVDDEGDGIGGAAILINGQVVVMTGSDGAWDYADAKKGAKVTVSKPGWDFAPASIEVQKDGQVIWVLGTRQTSSSYSVSGRVIDEDGTGIPTVSITITGDATASIVTDAQGNFNRSGLSGSVTITATKSGYTITSPVIVTGADENITFIATKDASVEYAVSGRVVDEDGRGIPTVSIAITGGTTANIVTDGSGNFSRSGLSGTVTITATKTGYTITGPIVVTGADDNLTFIATPDGPTEYAIGGRVVSARGLAVEGVLISVADENGTIQTAFTDSNGFFSKSGLIGRVAATAFLEGWEFTPESRIVNGEDLNLSFYGTPSVEYTYEASGLILMSDGTPVPSVSLRFEFLDLDREDLFTITTPDGAWNMDGLLGRVRITPTKDGLTFHPTSQTIDKAMMYVSFTVY